ncbi:MAG: carboxypeptidase-like regulatory domain-containing protein [Flavobacteriales bacterium]|nr:carboxypeptidase-like regulatory domain-containing protein [Flavobacteriales bacterium]
MFKWSVLCSLLLMPFLANAQQLVQTIRGTVVDEDSRVPLIGASVVVLASDPLKGSTTDVDGRFEITGLPVGRHTLRVQYLGYEPRLISEINVGSAREVILDLTMVESTRQLQEVVVKASGNGSAPNNEMAVVSTRSFSLEQSDRFAASINDPSRMALSFAGVNLTNDITNEIVIRGNAPRGLLWRLEGIEIPTPNHFNIDGVYAGNVSLLSNNLLDQSDFSTGAFPAEYGNALSGVYDIRLRTGNDRKRQYTVQFGLLGLEASAEGPFVKGKGSSYLFNYRYSTLALFKAMGVSLQGDLITDFQDFNLKLNFPTKKAGMFSVFAIGGLSNAYFEPQMDSTKWSRTLEWDSDRERSDNRTTFLASGISNRYIINERNYVRTTLAFTHSGTDLAHSYLTDSLTLLEFWNFKVNNNAVRAAVQFNSKLSAKHHLRYGVNYDLLSFTLSDVSVLDTNYLASGMGHFVQGYVQHKFRVLEELTLITGINVSYFDINHGLSIEPRAGLSWQPHRRHRIGLGLGLHSRQENLAFYLVKEQDTDHFINRSLDFSRAFHAVLSYDLTILPRLTAKTEFYWQYLYAVPVAADRTNSYSVVNDNFPYQKRPMVNDGIGMNYGAELTVEKGFGKNWYAMYTLSLYESRYQGSDEVWRSTRFNGNYVTSLTAGKDFRIGKEGRHVIGINMKLFWAGGNRYTPIDIEASIAEGEQVRDRDREYEGRLDDYFRLDTRVHFRQNFKKFAWEFSIDIQNTTNRKNEFKRRFDVETGTETKRYQQGILPVARLRFEF